ncbi:MAG: class I SAM-dependent rRNA methyltransferase, partial [Calditrichia bacterium]|nr:class I SAM-dependent rRNA methyltransferase [Calditrichia bacterium]
IICDPPGLAKKKSEVKKIQGHLVDISREMLRILNPGGWLVLFSCSHIMPAKFLTDTLRIAASLDQRPIYLKDTTHQPFDHPVLLQMPETAYLTGVWIIGG